MKTVFALLFVVYSLITFAQAGVRDSTFDGDGIGQQIFSNGSALAVIYTIDNKIVVGGADASYHNVFVKYKLDGTIDSSFGTNGVAKYTLGSSGSGVRKIVEQPDGKIVSVSSCRNSSGIHSYGVIRINADGSLDNTFNGTGKLIISPGVEDYSYNLTLQPDGKIIVVGAIGTDVPFADWMGIIRINSNGILDNTFGTNGVVKIRYTSTWCYAYSVALQTDGKIVVAGATRTSGSQYGFCVARLNYSGSLDNTFSGDGIDTAYFSNFDPTSTVNTNDDYCNSILIKNDGKIILIGQATIDNSYSSQLAFLQYNSIGSRDTTFGILGKFKNILSIPVFANFPVAKIGVDNKVVVGTISWDPDTSYHCSSYFLTRLIDDSLDATFGTSGYLYDHLNSSPCQTGELTYINDVTYQGDGKILVAGTSQNGFTVARYISGLNVGIDEIEIEDNIKVYPNPVGKKLNIVGTKAGGQIICENLLGQVVYQENCINEKTMMDVSGLVSGVYLLVITNKDGVVVGRKKMVKE